MSTPNGSAPPTRPLAQARAHALAFYVQANYCELGGRDLVELEFELDWSKRVVENVVEVAAELGLIELIVTGELVEVHPGEAWREQYFAALDAEQAQAA